MKYSQKFKLKCIKQFEGLNLSMGDIAKKKKIPKQTLSRWIRRYEKFGIDGLENQKKGKKETPINPEVERIIIQLWQEEKRSSYRMRIDLIKRGFNLPRSQVRKIYKKNNFVLNDTKI